MIEKNCIFKFCKNNNPIHKVDENEIFTLNTVDCFANQIKNETDELENIDFSKINPATGPIYVNGAMPGDIIKINILDIKLNEIGIIATGENLGVLGHRQKGFKTKIVKIKNDKICFNEKIFIDIEPMIGVIGVAPKDKSINCGTPGIHGGNMDNNMIKKGSILYLPVFQEGALLAVGDLHAKMGDGEIGVSGVECSGSVSMSVEIIKNKFIKNPILENFDVISTIASEETLDFAIQKSVEDMANILKEKVDVDFSELVMIMSSVGNCQICQIVDPLKTARFLMPKSILKGMGFEKLF